MRVLLAALLATVIAAAGAHAADNRCVVPAELMGDPPPLTRVQAALAQRRTLTILVIGGASTVGAAAGGPEMAFPARLEVALRERYPGIEMKVINAGRPRELTRAMVDRGVRVLDRGAWFLSGSHDDAVIDQTLQVVEDSVKAALR